MNKKIFFLLCMMLALGGCSTLVIRTDYDPQADFSGLRTFGWVSPTQAATGDIKLDNPFLDKRVRDAVDGQLAAKGYAKDTAGNPDFLLRYLVTIQEKTDVRTIDTFYGGFTPVWCGGTCYTTGFWMPQTVVYTYEQGTLVLDILDARTKILIWRGSAEAEVTESYTPEQRKAKVENAVKKLLAKFPPTKK
jgi:hypothetical protein